VMTAVREHSPRLLAQAQPGATASAIGVDVTAFTRATPVESTLFASGVVDLHRARLTIVEAERCWPTGSLDNQASDPFGSYGSALSGVLDIDDDVRGRLRVRLLGIDTPETKEPSLLSSRRKRSWGNTSRW
jgi:hypothetical protein